MTYGVIGNGSWATALLKILLETQELVNWWVLNDESKAYIQENSINPDYLSEVTLDVSRLDISTDVNHIINASDVILLAIPSIYLKEALANYSGNFQGKIIISAIKGIIPETVYVTGHYLQETYGISMQDFVVVSGPSHAEEVAMEKLTYLTVASENLELAEVISQDFQCNYIRTKSSIDPIGIEYATVLKNIYALACGVAHGLGFGDNFQAILMSNALREMKKILKVLSPNNKRRISESVYLGDLLVTGYSLYSRNRRLGNYIGKGYTLEAAIANMNMVAEGYYATQGMNALVENKSVSAPILRSVFKVLFERKKPGKVFNRLSEKID